MNLPQGSQYRSDEGRAHVSVSVSNDTVYITGVCDSLQRRVEYLERLCRSETRRAETYKNAVRTASESQSKSPVGARLLIGVLLLVVVAEAFIIYKFK